MINPDTAVPCRRAREEHGVTPDIIFIRNDGWSLGAPEELEMAAERQWADQWIGYLRRPSAVPMPYVNPNTEVKK